jgi:hypothetical protein
VEPKLFTPDPTVPYPLNRPGRNLQVLSVPYVHNGLLQEFKSNFKIAKAIQIFLSNRSDPGPVQLLRVQKNNADPESQFSADPDLGFAITLEVKLTSIFLSLFR